MNLKTNGLFNLNKQQLFILALTLAFSVIAVGLFVFVIKRGYLVW